MTEELKTDYKMEAMLCHLLSLSGAVGIPMGNILGPLIMWMTKKDESPRVDANGKESLNFQISIIIYTFCCLISIVGILLLPFLAVYQLVMVIIASVEVHDGED